MARKKHRLHQKLVKRSLRKLVLPYKPDHLSVAQIDAAIEKVLKRKGEENGNVPS